MIMTKKSRATQENGFKVPVAVPPNAVPMTKFIPGLTLHLPVNQKKLQGSRLHGPLFTLFESCARSKLKLKVRSVFDEQKAHWVVYLLIEDELISKGISRSNEKLMFQSYDSPLHCRNLDEAKFLAAHKAIDLLKNCPHRQNTPFESFLRPHETVPGLKLYLDNPCPQREDCLALLTESCRKCNLPVTWWDDEGCKVFKPSCITVLLINSKPICYAWGDTLEDSKKETAAEAILLLKMGHEVLSEGTDCELSCGTHTPPTVPGLTLYLPIPGRDQDALNTIDRSVSCSQLTWKFNDIGIVDRNRTAVYATNFVIGDSIVAWGYGKDAESSRKDIRWEAVLESLLDIHPILYTTDEETNFETTNTVVPGLTMYVPRTGSCRQDNDAYATIQRSLHWSNLHSEFKSMGKVMKNGKPVFATALHVLGGTIVAWGYGENKLSSRKNLSMEGTLDSLLKTQPTVYVDSGQQKLSQKAWRKRKRLALLMSSSNKVACVTDKDATFDYLDQGNERDVSYIVCSEWVDEENGGVDTMFDSDAVIRRYMESL